MQGCPTVPDAAYHLSFSFSVVNGLNCLDNLFVRSKLVVVDFKMPVVGYKGRDLARLARRLETQYWCVD
jgi:hypothetical protein